VNEYALGVPESQRSGAQMETKNEIPVQVVQLKTQLVSQGHTRRLLAETDLMTLRIHCYAPGIGENALHSHTKEDHIFVVLEGAAEFNTGRDGKTVVNARKHHAIVLPAGCYYQFRNSGESPLVMARIGAGSDKQDQRLNPDGTPIPGRTQEAGAAKPVLIEGAFFE
jgi:mannose-6-phosphate isomerase-like protein (cupin superfamily)